MDDLISRQALCEYAQNQKDKSITPNDIMRFPSAQPYSKELSSTHKALDTISRQDAIRIVDGIDTWQAGWRGDAIESMKALPSAQPETHDKRTETHACDLIDRQAAIDAHYEYCNKHPDAGFPVWSLKILEDLPSAQPEIVRCKDCIFHGFCRTSTTWAVAPKDDWFCADAERRTDGN